ncbi:hypothetical protein D9M68_539630 [compost metagenome]
MYVQGCIITALQDYFSALGHLTTPAIQERYLVHICRKQACYNHMSGYLCIPHRIYFRHIGLLYAHKAIIYSIDLCRGICYRSSIQVYEFTGMA